MAVLINSISQLRNNIRSYNKLVAKDPGLAALMPFNRSWYADQTDAGWLIGPSKFIGYQEPERYLLNRYSRERRGRVDTRDESAEPIDGRITEGILRRWSQLVERGDPRYDELHTVLNELCAKYGKKPNTLARISIVKSSEEAPDTTFDDDLVPLLAAVYRSLTPAQKTAFRKLAA